MAVRKSKGSKSARSAGTTATSKKRAASKKNPRASSNTKAKPKKAARKAGPASEGSVNKSHLTDENKKLRDECARLRKKARELKKDAAMYRDLFDNASDSIVILDENQRFVEVNKATSNMLGYTREELLDMGVLDVIPPEQVQTSREEFGKLEEKGGYSHFTGKVRAKSGRLVDVEVNSTAIYKGSKYAGSRDIVRDITERIASEEKLNQKTIELNKFFEVIPDLFFRLSPEGNLLDYRAPQGAELFAKPEDFLGRKLSDLMPGDINEKVKAAINEVRDGAPSSGFEYSLPLPSGDMVFEARVFPFTKEDYIALIRDITDHRRVEQRYEMLFSQMQAGFALHEIICDKGGKPVDYRFLAVNPAFERQTGLKAEGIVGKTVLEVIPNLERFWIEKYGKVALTGEPVEFENYAAGLDRYYEVVAFSPHMGQFACVFHDITDIKVAERTLMKSEERYRIISSIGSDYYYSMTMSEDGSSAVDWIGGAFTKVTGYETVYINDLEQWISLINPEDLPSIIDAKNELLRNRQSHLTYRIRKQGGGEIWLHDSSCPVFDEKEQRVVSVIGAVKDITGSKVSEIEIKRNLAEKDVLLKEVHHRVKNNLAVISSMLSLQARNIDDPVYTDMFNESQSRIKSMALVHEKLYQSEDFARIDIKDYIGSLVRNIMGTFAGGRSISTVMDIAPIFLDIDILVPVGLIINELLTNAVKYAFEGVDDPEIRVVMEKEDEGRVRLLVSDNGKGLPENFEVWDSKGLGLNLVKALLEQINASVEVKVEHGVAFMISFPEKLSFARRSS